MRTTLVLDDEVYEKARRRAFEDKRSLGAVVSDLVLKGLRAEDAQRPRRQLGQWAGRIRIAEDFDETPPDWLDAIDEPVDPAER